MPPSLAIPSPHPEPSRLIFIRWLSSLLSTNFISAPFHNLDQDEGFHDHAVTILLVAWGQFIDHDITLTAETKDIRHAKIHDFLNFTQICA